MVSLIQSSILSGMASIRGDQSPIGSQASDEDHNVATLKSSTGVMTPKPSGFDKRMPGISQSFLGQVGQLLASETLTPFSIGGYEAVRAASDSDGHGGSARESQENRYVSDAASELKIQARSASRSVGS